MTPATARLFCSCALLLAAGAASAQSLYRNVDANGRVTYTDRPPAANAQPAPVGRSGSGTAGASAQLPFELRQIVQRYPVTLYTGDDCAPCTTGRQLLQTRGIPFDERTVKSSEDIAALERLSGRNGLPLLTIGSQQLKGYSDTEWSQYLDAAGYPKSVQLPAGYRNPPAQPLVAQQAAPAAQAPAPAGVQPPPATPAPDAPTPSNPAGIRF
ncbi:MAG: glutaredoxin family protein [Rhodocyclaceae bacterium]|nr:glutaredoxin family protein [Pseudomonadota bacterium]MDQ7975158.1 glutaredoxin family protein [Rhodocyclaceae bacterium]MDQ8002207.1 glutaredoxin family protein [Pseudomonadota bacterium]MDQ8015340.1 glutaredoxin family protein [Pseudomonadota bacterium]